MRRWDIDHGIGKLRGQFLILLEQDRSMIEEQKR